MGRGERPAKAKVEAKSTVTRKSRNVDGSSSLQVNQRLAEALAQHAAISEILQVISASPSDVQPVLDTVAERAARLCEAPLARVLLVDHDVLRLMAEYSLDGAPQAGTVPLPLRRSSISGRAILDRATIHHDDVVPLLDSEYPDALNARRLGIRAALAVPLMREGNAYGAIFLWRRKPGLFSPEQVALVQTFAQQAAIAVDNVRLFNETKESLQQQTATADVLKVISRSAFDLQMVLETLTESACKLCDAEGANIWRPDGDGYKVAAVFGHTPEHRAALKRVINKPGRGTCVGRALLEGRTVHIRDAKADPEYNAPDVLAVRGNRTMIGVPLLREGAPIGVLVLTRSVARPFSEKQIALATTFADQAVIAIENVRLFNETKEALEQQTATSERLRVISQSPTDVQPVLDAVAERALSLCDAAQAGIFLVEEDTLRFAARFGNMLTPEENDSFPLNRGLVVGRAVIDRETIHHADIVPLLDTEYPDARLPQQKFGFRALLGVPLMREDRAIGAIALWRMEARRFTDKQIALVKTFAGQAAIAIENVRLFKELEERTTQLTQSVGKLRALGEVGQAVSSTLDLETVLSTVVSRATGLAGMDAGAIYEYDEARGEFYLHTADRLQDELVTALRAEPIRKGEGALGRMAMTGEPVQIRDIMTDASYQSRLREIVLRLGYRSLMAVPLMRDDRLLGGLVVYRKAPGEFDASVIDLLRTFATQSALAIQNARLFREIEEKSRELATASRHKSEFLANMSHELRTPLNAIIGFSEVLAERMFGEINDKQAEYLADILESGRHLLSLINDILDLSKIEAGRMELEPTEFNLPDAIENTLTLVRERAHRHGIALGRMVDERLGTICADERKVKQVLLNLLSNALKFTPEGGRIDVAASVTDNAIEISVSDTGVGIAAEDQAAVFEEFRQVGAASKKIEGTGLGLAISRKFIELHGGKIWVKSAVGSGSTFAFTLPLQ
jgi:signal transduction histidine kinase